MKKLFLILIVICSIGWYILEVLAFDTKTLWYIDYYADEFGESTQNKLITNISYIHGTFSNSAVQDADLNVKFLIDKTSISIMLYEYAGYNPVKVYSCTKYNVLIQDKDGIRKTLRAENCSDRLYFHMKIFSIPLHDALMKGGGIHFVIWEVDYPINRYRFTIESVTPLPKTNRYVKAYKESIETGSYANAYKELFKEE